MNSLSLNQFRCKCGKLLLKELVFNGTLEIKCKRCGTINRIENSKHKVDKNQYLLILNKDGIIINSNDTASKVLGYEKEELSGNKLTFINPTFPEEIYDELFGKSSILNEENYLQIDTLHKTKQGKNVEVTSNLKLLKPSEKEKYILLLVNRRTSEKENNLFDKNKFAKNICDFYFDIDSNGVMEYLDPSVDKIFEFSTEKMLGKNYFDFIPNENKIKDIETFRYFSSKGQPYRIVRDNILTLEGKKISCDLYFTSKFNSSGKFVGYKILGWKKEK
jgi:PAS domain S-box-containing protein